MSLWDKPRPRVLSKLDYHKEQAEHLRNLSQQEDFPHLMSYGPSGAGKKTRIMCLLRELYGTGVERVRNETMTFTMPSNRKVEVITVSSNYHLEVNPSDAGIYDRVVEIDLIKQVAQTHQIDPHGQRDFKVIVLSEVDELTKDAQQSKAPYNGKICCNLSHYSLSQLYFPCDSSNSQSMPLLESYRTPAKRRVSAFLQNWPTALAKNQRETSAKVSSIRFRQIKILSI